MNLTTLFRQLNKAPLITAAYLFLNLLSTSLLAKDAIHVSVQPLSELLVHETESAPAKIVDINHALLAAEISGRVLTIHVEKGDQVKKNQVLLEIDCKDYTNQRLQAKAALDAAEAHYELSQKQYKRNLALSLKNTISQNNVDVSLAQKNQARADVALKKAQLSGSHLAIDKCLIKAPFHGQITEKFSSLGDFLTPGKPVLRLLQTGNSKIEAQLTPIKSQSMAQAKSIHFMTKNLAAPLNFESMINIIDTQTNTLTARFAPQQTSNNLYIGLSGRIQWQSREGYLPAKYLVKRGEKLGVMITRDKKTANFHPVNGAIEGQSAKIDLPVTTLLIVTNLLTLQHADSILVE